MEQNQALTQQNEQAVAHPEYGTMLTDTKTLNTLVKMSNMFAASEMVPDTYRDKPNNCFVACELANRMDVSPMIVMQNLYIVHGKPAWSGQACISLINGTRLFAPIDFVFVGEKGQLNWGCYVQTTRLADGKVLTGTLVDMQLAKAEGWLDKKGSKWQTMPEQMLQYRAAAFFARVHCPHALMGLQTVDEVRDVRGYEEKTKKTIVINVEADSE